MQPKILAYAACVKAELDSGYTAATLMKVSIDPAWQDADDKFRQIIARCVASGSRDSVSALVS